MAKEKIMAERLRYLILHLLFMQKWLNVNEEENVYMCSECGDEVIFISGCPIQNGYKYCPFCGAKMGKRLRNNGKRNKIQSKET